MVEIAGPCRLPLLRRACLAAILQVPQKTKQTPKPSRGQCANPSVLPTQAKETLAEAGCDETLQDERPRCEMESRNKSAASCWTSSRRSHELQRPWRNEGQYFVGTLRVAAAALVCACAATCDVCSRAQHKAKTTNKTKCRAQDVRVHMMFPPLSDMRVR